MQEFRKPEQVLCDAVDDHSVDRSVNCHVPVSLTVRSLNDGYKIESLKDDLTIRLDGQGRWCSFRSAGHLYRRCLDGSVVKGASAGEITDSEHLQLLQQIRQTLTCWKNSGDHQARTILRGLPDWDESAYRTLNQLYADVYPEDVPILPPDRYGDVVVQPAKGCPNRRCTFCAFYKDKPFQVLRNDDLEQHLHGIIELLGPGLAGKSGVFLGSANAMALSQRRLLNCLDAIEKRLGRFHRGIAAFSDPDFSASRNPGEWQQLADRGLRRLVVGLETGWPELRARLGKSGDLTKVSETVNCHQKAGISTGLTILAGACSEDDSPENIRQTASFVEALGLNESDIIYLSPLKSEATDQQQAQMELAVLKKQLRKISDAKVVPYQMERFHYYA